MAAALHISRLVTRVRAPDPVRARTLKDQVRGLAVGPVQRAFEAACPLALARAGLPEHAFVAIRRLHLRLVPRGEVHGDDLAVGWARALQDALTRALLSAGETVDDGDDDDDLAWFADDWVAEEHYLAAQGRDAIPWWAGSLPTAGAPGMPPMVASVLNRWLDADPARTVAAMVRLLHRSPALARCLSGKEAESLVRGMLERMGASVVQWPTDRGAVGRSAPAGAPVPGSTSDSAPGDAAAMETDAAEIRVADLALRLSVALPEDLWSVGPEQRGPWVLAQMLSLMPSLGRLPALRLRALIDSVTSVRERLPVGQGSEAGEQSFRSDPVSGQLPEAPVSQTPSDSLMTDPVYPAAGAAPESVETFAAGLLLLIRPLARLDLLPPGPEAGALLGDLALAALRSVLAPLPPGEHAVAQERERALLGVFAPERDWHDPIRAIPVAQPARAQALLDRLQAEIPADIAAAGGLRSVFGATAPTFPTEPQRRLAYLLLRPGRLLINDWSAELVWPLAGIDLALRRAGWDQDPGWVPWLGRVIRFRFGAGP